MTDFSSGTVIRVLFPHVERNVRRRRPALVLTNRPVGPDGLLLWAAMITNAERERWPGDILIRDHEAVGLPVPSLIRTAKLATLETASASPIGRLSIEELDAVKAEILAHLGITAQ